MVKKYIKVLFMVLVAASIATVATAAEKKGKKMMDHNGVITAVDTAANTYTMKTKKGQEIICHVTSETPIVFKREMKDLSDLKTGDAVHCLCKVKDGKHVCQGLIILEKK